MKRAQKWYWVRGSLGGAMALTTAIVLANATALAEEAFRIGKQSFKTSSLYEENQAGFFEIEKQKYALIEGLAHDKYLDHYFEKLAKDQKTTPEAAREAYFQSNAAVGPDEIKQTLERFKDHPQLARFSSEERERQIRAYLEESKRNEALDEIITTAKAKGELRVTYPEPQEPIYKLTVNENDPVRYGPEPTDTKPLGCSGDACAITVVEYSEFQCPFCERVLPTVRRLMSEYKGKVRWVVRDFPLSFHDRARPAAIAAHCAGQQGKYWEMYLALFNNQRALADEDFKKYASKVPGIDMKKWSACLAKPAEVEKIIDHNFETGQRYGVTGTPAFFINGRRLAGALPYDEFKRVFDEELAKGGKS